MLLELNLRHFATVDQLQLAPAGGLTVITGETGAGKSVIIDALGLALGQRGDSDQVRGSCKRAEFSASFSLGDNPAAAAWLEERQLDTDDSCQLRRTITSDGRSRAWINGHPSTLQEVRSLANHLVSIHSQHEHQLLLQRDHQRRLLDDFAGASSLAQQVSLLWQEWQAAQRSLQDALDKANAGNEHEAFLRFQLQELDELALEETELEALETEQKRLTNADQLMQACQQSLMLLHDAEEASVESQVTQASQLMHQASQQDSRLSEVAEIIESSRLQLEAGTDDLRHYLDSMEQDPERLSQVENRLDKIYSLARKHRVRPEELPAHHQSLLEALAELDDTDNRIDALDAAEKKAATRYRKTAEKLSDKRHREATGLSKKVTAYLHQLGMKRAQLQVSLQATEASASGLEQVELRFTANPGQPLKSLSRVASGGELARVSLAIQVVCAERLTLPCLIFDEVDVGVGGNIADIVGQLLKQLGSKGQVLCITHQPQVASRGDQHWQVSKQQQKNSTETGILPMKGDSRIMEIARMLGGADLTVTSQEHAREMLMQGQEALSENAD